MCNCKFITTFKKIQILIIFHLSVIGFSIAFSSKIQYVKHERMAPLLGRRTARDIWFRLSNWPWQWLRRFMRRSWLCLWCTAMVVAFMRTTVTVSLPFLGVESRGSHSVLPPIMLASNSSMAALQTGRPDKKCHRKHKCEPSETYPFHFHVHLRDRRRKMDR